MLGLKLNHVSKRPNTEVKPKMLLKFGLDATLWLHLIMPHFSIRVLISCRHQFQLIYKYLTIFSHTYAHSLNVGRPVLKRLWYIHTLNCGGITIFPLSRIKLNPCTPQLHGDAESASMSWRHHILPMSRGASVWQTFWNVDSHQTCQSWWHNQMEAFSSLLALCAGNSPVTGEFPSQRAMTRSLGVFFDLRLNKLLSKQSRRQWFETPSYSLLRHCDDHKRRIYVSPSRMFLYSISIYYHSLLDVTLLRPIIQFGIFEFVIGIRLRHFCWRWSIE